jgi:hypothetical protein
LESDSSEEQAEIIACRFSSILGNFAASLFSRRPGGETLSSRLSYFSRHLVVVAVIATPAALLGGCGVMKYQKDFWNVDRYRDERAVDIDHRLEKSDTGVKNPF